MNDLRGGGSHGRDRVAVGSDSGGHGQYTVEGEIAQWGSFAGSAARRGGRAALVARVVVVVMLIGLLAGPLILVLGD